MAAGYDILPDYPDNRAAVPARLRPVQAFVNTLDLEHGVDGLGRPQQLQQLLADHDLHHGPVGDHDLAKAVRVREALRALFVERAGAAEHDPAAAALLEQTAAGAGLALSVRGGEVHLRASETGVAGALGELVVRVQEASLDGSLRRLKACRRSRCHWLFWDCSPPASGIWCTMAICGNRTKVRRFRAGSAA